jgi:acyl-CoA synthetase (AMP-forming)/AMP-acid ligase II
MSHVLNVGEILTVNAQLHPGRVAVKDLRRSLTNAQLEERANRLANAFAGLGLGKGDRVAIYAYNRLEWMEIYAACAKSGVIAVPVNFRLSGPEVRAIVEDCGAAVLLVDAALVDVVASQRATLPLRPSGYVQIGGERLQPGFRDYEDLLSFGSPRRPRTRVSPEDTWTLMYTSGTTGRPKGCLLTNRGWVAASAYAAHGLGVTGEDRLLAALPLFHVAGYGAALAHLATGGTVVFPAGAGADEAWSLVAEHGVTVAIFPAGTRRALRPPAARPVRLVYGMAGTERADTLRLLAELGCDYRGVYGSTEAGNFVTVSTLADELARPGTIGRPLPAFDVEIAAPPGEPGELLVRGPSMMSGYAGLPEATAEALRGGLLHTGDLVRRDDDGYLYFVDRAKDMIKTGGENVYSAEVERVLLAHPAVGDAAVVGVPDRRWGEAVKALVVTRAPVTAEELDEHCRARLGGFKRPRWYEFAAAIPRNHSGKVRKRDLRAAHDPANAVRLQERSQ